MTQIAARVEGNKWITTVEFRVPDENGTLTDPTTVVFTATRLNRTASDAGDTPTDYTYGTDPEVTRDSAGIYKFALVPADGRWAVHAQGTGAAYGAAEIEFVVTKSKALAS